MNIRVYLLLVMSQAFKLVVVSIESDLSRTSSGNGLCNLGDLIAGTDDLLSLSILVELDILVLPLGTLPDLHFHTALDDTDSHSGEQVVGGVGVHVYTSIELGSGVFADLGLDHGFASWVVFDEGGYVVNDTCDCDKGSAVVGLVFELVP